MNFSFDVKLLLPDEVNRIVGSDLNYTSQTSKCWQHSSDFEVNRGLLLRHVIDCMGHLSSKAQGLQHKITSGEKLKESDHVVYLMTDDVQPKKTKVVGILKMGYKKLFLQDRKGVQHERTPPCVLDFYVHESCQRVGFGKRLFDFMLRDLKVAAHQLAIDRPSLKFLTFLSRHYQLSRPVHQGNHFTVFEEMFTDAADDHNDSRATRWRRPDYQSSIGKRQSYPQGTVDNRNGIDESFGISRRRQQAAINSVADVVFGQCSRTCADMSGVSQRNNSYVPQCTTNNLDRTMRDGGGIIELRPTRDSSFNIFGVPSPDYGRGGFSAHR